MLIASFKCFILYNDCNSIIRDQHHPDMLLSIGKTTLYMTELTVGFEANLNINAERKQGNIISLLEIFL